jgi:hypothetical protein
MEQDDPSIFASIERTSETSDETDGSTQEWTQLNVDRATKVETPEQRWWLPLVRAEQSGRISSVTFVSG